MSEETSIVFQEGVLHGLRSASALVEQFEQLGSSWAMLTAAITGMIAALEADEQRHETAATKGITSELLHDVAAWYTAGGVQLVQQRTGMSRSTAHRYVARAKAAGALSSNNERERTA